MSTDRGPADAGAVATHEDSPRYLTWPGILAPVAAGIAGLAVLWALTPTDRPAWLPDPGGVLTAAALGWVATVGAWWWRRCQHNALTPSERVRARQRNAALARVKKEQRAYARRVQACRARLATAKHGRPHRTLRGIRLADLDVTVNGRTIPLTPRVSATCDPNRKYRTDPENPDRLHPDSPDIDVHVVDDEGRTHRARVPAGDYADAQQMVAAINVAAAASLAVRDQQRRDIADATSRLEAVEADTADLDAVQRALDALGPDPMIEARARWKANRQAARQAGGTPDTWTVHRRP